MIWTQILLYVLLYQHHQHQQGCTTHQHHQQFYVVGLPVSVLNLSSRFAFQALRQLNVVQDLLGRQKHLVLWKLKQNESVGNLLNELAEKILGGWGFTWKILKTSYLQCWVLYKILLTVAGLLASSMPWSWESLQIPGLLPQPSPSWLGGSAFFLRWCCPGRPVCGLPAGQATHVVPLPIIAHHRSFTSPSSSQRSLGNDFMGNQTLLSYYCLWCTMAYGIISLYNVLVVLCSHPTVFRMFAGSQ